MGGGVGFIVFRLPERGSDMGQPENYPRVPYGLLASRALAKSIKKHGLPEFNGKQAKE